MSLRGKHSNHSTRLTSAAVPAQLESMKEEKEEGEEREEVERRREEGKVEGDGEGEELDEFSNQLRSLELTMRQHFATMTSSSPTRGGAIGLSKIELLPLATEPALPPRTLSRLRREGTKVNGPSMPNRKDKVTVYMRVVFLKVGEIDTLRDRFTADAFIQSRWREPAMDGKIRLANEDINWEIYWNPKLSIDNVFGEPKETVWYSVTFDPTGLATVSEKRRINGNFLEFMELNQFPFDTQDLSVTVTTDRSVDEIEFVKDPREPSSVSVQSFVDEQEWTLHRSVHTWTRTREEAFKNVKSKHPSFSAACKSSRRPQFFIWNIFVVMFLICSLSFATFSVSFLLPQNRLQLSFILLLTTVSFKFVVNQSLPMISYLTYLIGGLIVHSMAVNAAAIVAKDKYILGSMAILCCICIWHAVIPVIYTYYCYLDAVWNIDMIAFAVLLAVYIAFHIGLVAVIVSLARENTRSELLKMDDETNEDVGISDLEEIEMSCVPQNTVPMSRSEGVVKVGKVIGGEMNSTSSDVMDSKARRVMKAVDSNTSQQAAMTAWQ